MNPNLEKENDITEPVLSDKVYSIKSHREVNPEAQRGIVAAQLKDFEGIKAQPLDTNPTPNIDTPPEKVISAEALTFEKVKSEWKEARDNAHKIEADYQEKYQAHILEQSKGWRALVNVPRRMFGLQPRLSRELDDLYEASLLAREQYKEAGLKLKEVKSVETTIGQAEKLAGRYQRLLAYHLTVSVHKERLERQKAGMGQAWQESKYLKPTLETLAKHKYAVMTASLGVGVLTAGAPVIAGVTAGLITRFGVGKILDKTYVESARKALANEKEMVGDNFFENDFTDADMLMEHLTYDVGAREAVSKTIATAAGIAAGVGAAGYVKNLDVDNITHLPPDSVPVTPEAPSVTDTNPGNIEITTPENVSSPEVINTPDVDVPDTESAPVYPESIDTHSTIYTVDKGDNVWNVLEGKGPDSNPVGGQSEVLHGMSVADRQDALDKLVAYAEQNPDFAKEVGAVQSGGDINRIYPGEKLNISLLDDKLRELLGIENGTTTTAPHFNDATSSIDSQIDTEPISVEYSENAPEPMNNGDLLPVPEDNQAVAPTVDQGGDIDFSNTIGGESVDTNSNDSIVENTVDNRSLVAVRDYVTEVEKPTRGLIFSGRPDVSGTFDSLQNMTIGDFKNLAASDNLNNELATLGISYDGFVRWGETLTEQVKLVPANDNQTIGQYINSVVSNSAVA